MNDRKRAAHGAATPGRRNGAGTTCGAPTTSRKKNTTQDRTKQPGKIESLLSNGAENAITLSHLVAMTELPARQVRQMIQAERLRGVQILADNQNGYFLPANETDVETFTRSMFHRAREITRVANAVRLGGD